MAPAGPSCGPAGRPGPKSVPSSYGSAPGSDAPFLREPPDSGGMDEYKRRESKVTDRERKSMTRAALLLAGAALVRFIVAPEAAQTPLEGRESIADSLVAAGDSALEEKERRNRPFEPGETIDPNLAGEVELDRLPGVGASRARQIVEDRERNGPFASVEDLTRIRGIGARSIERLRPLVRISSGRGTSAGGRMSADAAARHRADDEETERSSVPTSPAGGPVDINRATETELRELPGIGPVTAARIVAYRELHGGFRTPEELMEVSGVGAKTFARLASLVTVR